jgi:hypothetical protein
LKTIPSDRANVQLFALLSKNNEGYGRYGEDKRAAARPARTLIRAITTAKRPRMRQVSVLPGLATTMKNKAGITAGSSM